MRSAHGVGRLGDVSGAVADLGVMVPLATALVLVNGLDAGAVFLWAGLLVIVSGLAFGIPFPVQPLKALTAVAVARELTPGVIHAAGLEIGIVLLVLAVTGAGERLARLFTEPIVRALQLGVGILLVKTAANLVLEPPEVFGGTPAPPWPLLLAGAAFAVVWWAARTHRYVAALVLLVVGAGITVVVAAPALTAPSLSLPSVALPAARDLGTALPLLVLPQLPLTFGNAVVAVRDVARDTFGDDAKRVTPSRVCVSCGIGNVVAALAGGVPMCHGAGGLTAHVRLGARTTRMSLLLGGTFVLLGLLFAPQIPTLLGVLPVWVLGAFLAYAGLRHAWLVADLRGGTLVVAVLAGTIGAWSGNLAWTLAVGLAFEATRVVRVRLATAGAR